MLFKRQTGIILQEAVLSQRGRAMLCAVVSFNHTITLAQSFIMSYFGFKFINAYNKILFCCLRHNVTAFCHKQDSLLRCGASSVFRDQQTQPLKPATHEPKLSADIDDRQCWLVCRGSRQCRATNLTFIFTCLLVVFFAVFSGKLWHFVVKFPTFIVGRRAI